MPIGSSLLIIGGVTNHCPWWSVHCLEQRIWNWDWRVCKGHIQIAWTLCKLRFRPTCGCKT